MWNIFSLNRLEAKEDIVQFQKAWCFRDQLIEIYQHIDVPEKRWKKGAPYWSIHWSINDCNQKVLIEYSQILFCDQIHKNEHIKYPISYILSKFVHF